MKNRELPSITVDIQKREDGTLDIWILHEGTSGSHYVPVTPAEIGKYVQDEVELLLEMGY